ncbi:MAG: hypothetical protein K6E54_03715 [Bacteroidaceae bacterium]|nr:hypothetical protein [Bacteroidaceae bacterium]
METTKTSTTTVEEHSNSNNTNVMYLGVDVKTQAGIGVAVITELSSVMNMTIGGELNESFSGTNTKTTTVSTTEEFATSDSHDFVGANGDVFIGSAKNLIFGACHQVLPVLGEDGKYKIAMQDAISTGEEYTTSFSYTANYVENVLIPNFIKLRNSLLTYNANIDKVSRPKKGESPIYVTTLKETDSNYGSDNDDETVWGKKAMPISGQNIAKSGKYSGPSYTMILPAGWKNENYQDMVKYYNDQIARWKKTLADNEEAKVTAIKNRSKYLVDNHSIDAGSRMTFTHEETTTEAYTTNTVFEANVILGLETGFTTNGAGVGVTFTENAGITTTWNNENSDTHKTSISYTLAEDGDDDYLSVDVFNAPDGFGPIFYTRAGATSDPYEDEVLTKYYKPGSVIQEKTLQIEKPEIEVLNQEITGVPAGKDAVFQIALRNNSDTKEDCYFGLWVEDASNPNGAQVFMDGLNITKGVEILVPFGETIKTLVLRQTNTDVLDYKNIDLCLYSTSQPDDTGTFPGIYSNSKVSVSFQPTCSDITMEANTNVVNTETTGPVILSVSNYNRNLKSLKGVRIQYKGINDANFVTLQEYTTDSTLLKKNKNLKILPVLTGTSKLTYSVDLNSSNYSDQTYVFRAITVCQINGVELNNESEEIEIVRDMSAPQLIASPTPTSGVLGSGDDISITFNEDIRGSILGELENFKVVGVKNESKVLHDVALSLSGAESAKTEATVDLAEKAFSINMWLNYSADGKIFQHGTSVNNFTAAIEKGKLAVTVGGKKVTSSASLPKNKWLYLSISYDNSESNPVIYAGYAQDASSVSLINGKEIPEYSGNGPISLGGNGFTAKLHELSLWNTARTLTDAQADMYNTKNQYTKDIIGYWRFNEGYGEMAVDRSRSRNITLPSKNSWWINGKNYSLSLDGKTAADINITALNTLASDSYMIEGWFRVDPTQKTAGSIMSMGEKELEVCVNTSGNLELVANGSTTKVYANDVRDGEWHHLALNVVKSTSGSAIVYVDGKASKQFAASSIPAISGSVITLGAHRTTSTGVSTYERFLKGNVDEVRIWKARRTADVIYDYMHSRVDSSYTGLVAYYPMEVVKVDDNNQAVTSGSPLDMVTCKTNLTVRKNKAGTTSTGKYVEESPALTPAPILDNVAFGFVASERKVLVNLEEEPSKIEECTVYITVKDVKDLSGNASDPITWSVYVKQSNLKWSEPEIALTKQGTNDASFSVNIENNGGTSENWVVTGMPSWLSVSVESGTLKALGTRTLKFDVNPGVPVGTYETTIYLVGSQKIEVPLNLTLTVEGNIPEWIAEEDEMTMNVVGQVVIDGVYSSDPKDMIAAFRGTKCVGVASPQYYPRYDSYIVLMTVYGNSSVNNSELTYKIYDSSTGETYPSVSASNVAANKFVADTWVGTFADCTVFTPNNKIEQSLALDHSGWKWFSFYLTPDENRIEKIFDDSADAIHLIKNESSTSIYSSGKWGGNLKSFNMSDMYKLNADEAYDETVIGTPADPSKVAVTLNKGWSWIGYPATASNSLDAAFADASPAEGDLVKNQSAFSIYTAGEWVGTLEAMTPGEGYNYFSNASQAKTFHFATPVMTNRRNVKSIALLDDTQMTLNYESNMTIIAVIMDGDQIVEDANVSVYAGTELRGYSASPAVDDKYFITVGGNKDKANLSFVVTTSEGDMILTNSEMYNSDAQLGSLENPYILQLGNATAINDIANNLGIKMIQLYDGSGRIIKSRKNPTSFFTKKDLDSESAGVYYQKIIYNNNQTNVVKIMK